MPLSPSSAQITPATIERCRIVAVNIKDYSVDVITEYSQKEFTDVSFAVPYTHQSNGEGIYFVPEVGATCWICASSDDQNFVIGFSPVVEEGGFRGGRPLLNPGDIRLSTRDDNFIVLRRGGMVQIGSTAVCQRVYMPIRNIIKDFAENYELHTPGGDLLWQVAREEDNSEGHKGTTFSVSVKEFSDDPNDKPLALLKIGSHGEDEDTILTLETRDKGGGTVKIGLTFSKTGDVNWTIEKDLSITTKGNINIESEGTTTLKSKKAFSIESATAKLNIKSVGMTLNSSSTLDLKANATMSLNAALIKLNSGVFPILRNSPDFVVWMATVTALVNTLPPAIIAPVIPPSQFFNPKVLT